MKEQYDYSKFREWLLLKKYSPATAITTIRITEYFRAWSEGEGITELSEISYQDAMSFMHGAASRE